MTREIVALVGRLQPERIKKRIPNKNIKSTDKTRVSQYLLKILFSIEARGKIYMIPVFELIRVFSFNTETSYGG